MKRLLSFLLALAMCVGMLPAGVWADPAQDGQTSEPTTEITAPVESTQPTETEAPTEAPTVEATETTEPEVTEPEATEPETVPETKEAEETQPETEEVQSDYRLVITEQPEDTQIVGGTAYYYVGAELLENDSVVEDALLSYRWQQKTDEDWTDIEGQTVEVLTAQEPSRDSVFRCVVSWEDLEVISESAGILADEPENMGSVTHLSTTTKVYISPLYQGKITEEEVLAELAARPETCALTPDCYSWDEFNAAVKEALHNHEESFSVSIWLENQVGNDFWNYVFNEFEHNGDPIMGDYAVGRYTGGTKSCDVDAVQKTMPDGSTKTYYVYTYKNDFLHRTTQAQEKAVDAKVDQILQELNVDGKTDVEKVYAIYDYMINHIRYDYEHLDDATYMQKYTAYAALVENTSVCMGYALAFYRLALACGVDARYINSDPMNHAWDIVKVDGQYYYLDATWDEKITHDTADLPGSYFLRGTESWQRIHVYKGISDPGTLNYGQSLADNGYVVSAADYHDWTLSEDGTLTIPTGIAFLQSDSNNKSPFAAIADQVRSIRLTAPIRRLPYAAFEGLANVESIVLSDTIERIEDRSLYGCNSLKSIALPDKVTELPEGMFRDNEALESVKLPAALKEIRKYTFCGCKNLKDVTFGDSLEKIGENAFYGCEGLETAAFPDSLKTIEDGAFFGSGLKKLTLGANVKTVGSSAFGGGADLEELTILSDKVTFGESAIWTSGDLNTLTMPASLRITQGTVSATRIGTLTLTGPGKMADYSEEQLPFWDSVENVIIEDSVTQLGRYGLAGNFINHVELPEGITDIPEGFLWNNQTMESIRLPASVTHIGNKAFGQMNSSGEQYPTIVFTGKNLPKLEANAFVGLKYNVICVYPCNWTTKPSGSYGGASVWGEVAWVSSHILTHYPAQPATEEKNGWLEHWKCDACGKLFLDEKGERPTTAEEIVDRVAGTYILTYENMEGIENPNPAGWSTNETLVLQAPRQPGFRFLGWSLDQAGRQIVDSIPAGERTEITLYAQWKVNTYTIHFDANGGAGKMKDQSLVYNAEASLTANAFTRTGYVFAGWADAQGNAYEDKQTISKLAEEGTVELTAQWTPIAYTVAFQPNGGQGTMEPVSMTYDQTAELPQLSFTREGYRFTGWAPSARGKAAYADGEQVVNLSAKSGATVTLYAQWTPNSYTVVYEGNGADKGTMKPKTMLCGKTYTLTANAFSRTGYAFQGWATDPDSSTPEYTNSQKGVALSTTDQDVVTLYAVWAPVTYKLTYKNLTVDELTQVPQTYTIEDTIELPAMSRDGFDFGGWYLDGAFRKPADTISGIGAKTIYAKWTAHKYTVTFHGSGADKGTMKDQPMVCGTAKALTKNAFTRVGYTFSGWTRDPNSGNAEFTNGQKTLNLTYADGDTVELYAVWTPIVYKITYKNLTADELTQVPQTYTIEDMVQLPAMARDGFDFGGWYLDGAFKKPADTISGIGARTIYAKWTAHKYTVTFHGNGADKGAMKDQPMVCGTAKALTKNAFTRVGYTFSGWTRDPNSGNAEFTNGQKTLNLTYADGDTVELYAVWTPIVYKITYKNLTAEELSKVPQSYTIEDSLLLRDLHRRGYDFGGWYLDGAFKKPVDTISGIGAKTIYAKWTAHKYTVNFRGNGADKGAMKDQPMVCGTARALTRNAYTRTGYIFAGWARDPISGVVDFTNGEKVLQYYETDNYVMELFAVWVPIQYKITYKNLTAAEAELMEQTYTVENTIYLPERMRDGFDFGGWYSDGAFKKPVETISGMGARTVYAKWTAHKYTVVFDGNGADKGAMKDQPMVFGTARALTRNAYTRTGYTFLGWSADPLALEAQYKNCEKLQNLTDKDGGIVTLYAVWKAK